MYKKNTYIPRYEYFQTEKSEDLSNFLENTMVLFAYHLSKELIIISLWDLYFVVIIFVKYKIKKFHSIQFYDYMFYIR